MGIKRILAPRNAWAVLAVSVLFALPSRRVAGDGMYRLQGHVPNKLIHLSQYLGPKGATETMKLAVVLKPRDPAGLEDFLRRLQDPNDAEYHRYLTPAEFADRFGPSESDVQQLADHFARYGLSVTNVHPNRLVLDLEGPTSAVEDAFQVQVGTYRAADGRVAHVANADPIFPVELAAKVSTVAGLNGFARRQPHLAGARAIPNDGAHSVGDFMTPAKVASAYSLPATTTANGAGETLALFELDGYTASDITSYATYFNLPAPTLQNVLVDNATGTPGSGAIEVTLDIELALSVAPGLGKILVYEGQNTDQGVLDTYNKIATDNLAKEVSTSWGSPEGGDTTAFLKGENAIFQQMAAQGQSLFAASGDSGAFDDANHPTNLAVDDPASQPYVTAVGGTTLTLNSANNTHVETAWNGGVANPQEIGNDGRLMGGGGGVSTVWPLPSWQVPVSTSVNGESTTNRMVPDVALDADPETGYPVFVTIPPQPGQQPQPAVWIAAGGTSCAAPMWAAFMALVNQKRVSNGQARIGFANPAIYQVAESAQYSASFFDVSDGSTNLNFATTPDYDLATGWGSFLGTGLFNNLTAASLPAALAAPGAPSGLAAKVGN